MKLYKYLTKGFCLWMLLGMFLFAFFTSIFTILAGEQVQSIPVSTLAEHADQVHFQGTVMATTGNDPKIYFNRGKEMMINYIDLSVENLSIPTINVRLYYADTEDGFNDKDYVSFFIHNGFNEIKVSVGEKEYLRLHIISEESISMTWKEVVLRSAIRPLYRIPQGFLLFIIVWLMLYAAGKLGIRYNNIQQSILVLLEGMFAVFMILIILFSIGSVMYRFAVYLLIPFTILTIVIIYPQFKVYRINTVFFASAVLIFMTGVMCFIGYQMLTPPLSDVGTVYYSAWEIATGGRVNTVCTGQELHTAFFSASNNDYFLRYHNNIPILAILSLFYKILFYFGLTAEDLMSNYMSVLLNIAFIMASIIFGMFAAKNMYGKKGEIIYLLMSAFFVPYYINACRYYTDTISMTFVTLTLWLNTIDCKKFKSPYIKYVSVAISLCVGAFIKGSVFIMLLALSIQLALQNRKNFRFILMMLIVTVMLNGAWSIYIKNCSWIDMHDNDKWEFPLTSRVMMSLDRSVNGGYSQRDLEYVAQYPTKEERKSVIMDMIQYRIGNFGSLCDLFEYEFSKAAGTWCDGQYMQDIHITWSINKGTLFDALIPGRRFNGFYKVFTQTFSYCMYLFAIAGAFLRLKNPKTDHAMFLRLTMLGVILFFMIWETKSRYLLNYTPVFMLAAIQGAQEMSFKLKEAKKYFER